MTTTLTEATAEASAAAQGRPLDRALERLSERFGAWANVQAVFGEPIQQGEVTVVPVARVRWGVGLGSGNGGEAGPGSGSGGGGGAAAEPVGYLEIRTSGAVFQPIRPSNPSPILVSTGGLAAALVLRALVASSALTLDHRNRHRHPVDRCADRLQPCLLRTGPSLRLSEHPAQGARRDPSALRSRWPWAHAALGGAADLRAGDAPLAALLAVVLAASPALTVLSMVVGATAAVVQGLGLVRWPFAVPELARRYVGARGSRC